MHEASASCSTGLKEVCSECEAVDAGRKSMLADVGEDLAGVKNLDSEINIVVGHAGRHVCVREQWD